jgi:glyoxylase-like metal-dependent hydrolase (beta-lactamase superfamily II)
MPQYLQAIRELDLKLVRAIDPHPPADHVSGLSDLYEATDCVTALGEQNYMQTAAGPVES